MSNSRQAPWTAARQAPLSMGFCRQECLSGDRTCTPGVSCIGRPVLHHSHHLGSSVFGGDTKVGAVFLPATFIPKASRERSFSSQRAKGSLQKHWRGLRVPMWTLGSYVTVSVFFKLEEPSEAWHYLLHMDAYYNPCDVPSDTGAGVNMPRFTT